MAGSNSGSHDPIAFWPLKERHYVAGSGRPCKTPRAWGQLLPFIWRLSLPSTPTSSLYSTSRGWGSANHILLFQLLCMDYRETRGRHGEKTFLLKWLLLSSASSEEWHLAPVAAPLCPLITRRLCPSGGSNAPAGVPLRELSTSSIGARLPISGLKNPTLLCVSTPVNGAASCNYYH